MHPILFRIGPLTVYSYGVLVATGVLAGLWYARRQAPRAGLDPDKVWNLGIYMVLAALIIAKIWLVLSAWDYYIANPGKIFSVETFQSGGTFYGGMVGAVLTVLLYTYFQKMPLLPVMDTIGAAVPLGHVIGRLGCFAAGCCYGRPTSLPWGVKFTSPTAERLAAAGPAIDGFVADLWPWYGEQEPARFWFALSRLPRVGTAVMEFCVPAGQ